MQDSRREAVALLSQINRLSEAQFQRCLSQLFLRDEIAGPLAVAYLLQQMKKICPASEAWFWDEQISNCTRAARLAHRVHGGWKQYGLESPYAVLDWQVPPQLARYNSEPKNLGSALPDTRGCRSPRFSAKCE